MDCADVFGCLVLPVLGEGVDGVGEVLDGLCGFLACLVVVFVVAVGAFDGFVEALL